MCKPRPGQFLSPFFLREKQNGDDRFILNLKDLNLFMNPPHFKMEDIKTALRLIRPDCYFASIDLKDGYLHVPIQLKYRKYLRFTFDNKCYEFSALPFGLCTAPYIFTKILKPVVKKLRENGVVLVVYLDDILIISRTEDECKNNINLTKNLLENLGFVINSEKSELTPSKNCKYLGFILNSVSFSVELPLEKRKSIGNLAEKFSKKKSCKIRELARFLGTLVAACPAIQYGWLYTKRLEREKFLALKNSNNDFNAKMNISDTVIEDIEWWIRNAKTMINPIRTNSYTKVIFTDASLSGWGSFCNGEKAHGWWDKEEKDAHINYLELKAAFYGLKCHAKNSKDCSILLRIDNTTAISYINRMGGIQYPKLTEITRSIWKWCEDRMIWIHASYIESKENKEADEQSRVLPHDTEWELADLAFETIVKKFGKFDIDLFASRANSKCNEYVSWHRDPDSIAIDAFTINWSGRYFYAFPPFCLVLQTLQKIQEDKAEGVVVVPMWPSQPWYPLFIRLMTSEQIFLKPNINLLTCPFRKIHPLHETLTLVVARLSGKRS